MARHRLNPRPAAVVVASEARAVVESVDEQARQVLLHLPEDALLTLTVPPEIKSIDKLKPGDHVAVKYYDAAVIHLAKTDVAPTAKSAPGTTANGEVQGVKTVVASTRPAVRSRLRTLKIMLRPSAGCC